MAVDGFVIPINYDAQNYITDFALAKNQMSCCYGGTPQIHEFIIVHVAGRGVNAAMDVVTRVKGVLTVGARRQRGCLTSIYRMEAESVGESPE